MKRAPRMEPTGAARLISSLSLATSIDSRITARLRCENASDCELCIFLCSSAHDRHEKLSIRCQCDLSCPVIASTCGDRHSVASKCEASGDMMASGCDAGFHGSRNMCCCCEGPKGLSGKHISEKGRCFRLARHREHCNCFLGTSAGGVSRTGARSFFVESRGVSCTDRMCCGCATGNRRCRVSTERDSRQTRSFVLDLPFTFCPIGVGILNLLATLLLLCVAGCTSDRDNALKKRELSVAGCEVRS